MSMEALIYNPLCDYQNISDKCEKQIVHVNVTALLQEVVGLQYFCCIILNLLFKKFIWLTFYSNQDFYTENC